MEWISVKDKFPGDKEHCKHSAVLVCIKDDDDIFSPRFSIGRYHEDTGWEIMGDLTAYSCQGFLNMESKNVTHWAYIEYPR